jgi:isopenicillin N synthase-like dioxygenase
VSAVPLIDLSGLRDGSAPGAVAARIDAACRDTGFFGIVGHGVPPELRARLDRLAREFFALPVDEKARIAMARGGRAWRGWFPVEGELTSGTPDLKEGIYFGQELGPDDPRVLAGVPLHGANLFPERPAGLGPTVLEYLAAVTEVGHLVLRGVALGLGLDQHWFAEHLTADPLVLFRIFHYPPPPPDAGAWGVGEHTDYGLVTVLGQDASGGLEVRGRDGWVPVPPHPDAFVINIGDMLERMTGGVYRSTPHRVRNTSGADRLSFPLFLDPNWDAEVLPVPAVGTPAPGDAPARWDGRDVLEWSGTYGDYLLDKVGRVFPDLRADVIDDG